MIEDPVFTQAAHTPEGSPRRGDHQLQGLVTGQVTDQREELGLAGEAVEHVAPVGVGLGGAERRGEQVDAMERAVLAPIRVELRAVPDTRPLGPQWVLDPPHLDPRSRDWTARVIDDASLKPGRWSENEIGGDRFALVKDHALRFRAALGLRIRSRAQGPGGNSGRRARQIRTLVPRRRPRVFPRPAWGSGRAAWLPRASSPRGEGTVRRGRRRPGRAPDRRSMALTIGLEHQRCGTGEVIRIHHLNGGPRDGPAVGVAGLT